MTLSLIAFAAVALIGMSIGALCVWMWWALQGLDDTE